MQRNETNDIIKANSICSTLQLLLLLVLVSLFVSCKFDPLHIGYTTYIFFCHRHKLNLFFFSVQHGSTATDPRHRNPTDRSRYKFALIDINVSSVFSAYLYCVPGSVHHIQFHTLPTLALSQPNHFQSDFFSVA